MSQTKVIPDHTAVRVALWRALHVELDSAPSVVADTVGLKLIAPEDGWKNRGDMHPMGTRGYRASIVGRARLFEDIVEEKIKNGVDQYVILGAGVDTFAQRRPDLAAKVKVFEIDQPDTQAWKRERLEETGFGIAGNLVLVPVDFESGESWRKKLSQHGFNDQKPAVVASTGVSMYLTRETNKATMTEISKMAPGTTFAMTFMLPLEMLPAEERPGHERVYAAAKAAGTPFISFFKPPEAVALALEAGFKTAKHVSREEVIEKYFKGRADGLEPSPGEEFLIATV
ncbi:SAM-dependent methyltransferase [Bdellovibrio sp. ZAP7]|uniref:class I SAM-dependent methyltransferase n=1 Tax=Bdellovibrio sp. ZAP7 TaxID=2231053 RepID=UPI001159B2BD|nr:class I SAM-dependent methyltransferase [Bdellovibrio sp. ZAP7]QDK43930.1 SAM-dependent methyltransferase [Bdellovibrio sp. ZAP7]